MEFPSTDLYIRLLAMNSNNIWKQYQNVNVRKFKRIGIEEEDYLTPEQAKVLILELKNSKTNPEYSPQLKAVCLKLKKIMIFSSLFLIEAEARKLNPSLLPWTRKQKDNAGLKINGARKWMSYQAFQAYILLLEIKHGVKKGSGTHFQKSNYLLLYEQINARIQQKPINRQRTKQIQKKPLESNVDEQPKDFFINDAIEPPSDNILEKEFLKVFINFGYGKVIAQKNLPFSVKYSKYAKCMDKNLTKIINHIKKLISELLKEECKFSSWEEKFWSFQLSNCRLWMNQEQIKTFFAILTNKFLLEENEEAQKIDQVELKSFIKMISKQKQKILRRFNNLASRKKPSTWQKQLTKSQYLSLTNSKQTDQIEFVQPDCDSSQNDQSYKSQDEKQQKFYKKQKNIIKNNKVSVNKQSKTKQKQIKNQKASKDKQIRQEHQFVAKIEEQSIHYIQISSEGDCENIDQQEEVNNGEKQKSIPTIAAKIIKAQPNNSQEEQSQEEKIIFRQKSNKQPTQNEISSIQKEISLEKSIEGKSQQFQHNQCINLMQEQQKLIKNNCSRQKQRKSQKLQINSMQIIPASSLFFSKVIDIKIIQAEQVQHDKKAALQQEKVENSKQSNEIEEQQYLNADISEQIQQDDNQEIIEQDIEEIIEENIKQKKQKIKKIGQNNQLLIQLQRELNTKIMQVEQDNQIYINSESQEGQIKNNDNAFILNQQLIGIDQSQEQEKKKKWKDAIIKREEVVVEAKRQESSEEEGQIKSGGQKKQQRLQCVKYPGQRNYLRRDIARIYLDYGEGLQIFLQHVPDGFSIGQKAYSLNLRAIIKSFYYYLVWRVKEITKRDSAALIKSQPKLSLIMYDQLRHCEKWMGPSQMTTYFGIIRNKYVRPRRQRHKRFKNQHILSLYNQIQNRIQKVTKQGKVPESGYKVNRREIMICFITYEYGAEYIFKMYPTVVTIQYYYHKCVYRCITKIIDDILEFKAQRTPYNKVDRWTGTCKFQLCQQLYRCKEWLSQESVKVFHSFISNRFILTAGQHQIIDPKAFMRLYQELQAKKQDIERILKWKKEESWQGVADLQQKRQDIQYHLRERKPAQLKKMIEKDYEEEEDESESEEQEIEEVEEEEEEEDEKEDEIYEDNDDDEHDQVPKKAKKMKKVKKMKKRGRPRDKWKKKDEQTKRMLMGDESVSFTSHRSLFF